MGRILSQTSVFGGLSQTEPPHLVLQSRLFRFSCVVCFSCALTCINLARTVLVSRVEGRGDQVSPLLCMVPALASLWTFLGPFHGSILLCLFSWLQQFIALTHFNMD